MKAVIFQTKIKASYGEAQRAVLELLRTKGPMQRWQICAALGKHCGSTVGRLLAAGCVEKYQDDNRDPNPCSMVERYQAEYLAFVRDLDNTKQKRARNFGDCMSKKDKMKDSYTPLSQEQRTTVETACAAWHLGRRPQTLRIWACKGDGPLKPIQINGRLHWRVYDIKRLLGA